MVFEETGTPQYPEKNSRSKDENQQQSQPTHDAETGNRTRAADHPCSPWALLQSIHVTCDRYFKNLNRVLKFNVSFEHQRDFRVPVQISQIYWRYKAMNFYLHYSIKYFKNNICFPSILNLFFCQLMRTFLERFPDKCSTLHSNAGHYKAKFECSFHSRKYWSRVTLIDRKGLSTYSVDCLCEFLDCGGAIKTKHLNNNNKSKSHTQLLFSSLNSLTNMM